MKSPQSRESPYQYNNSAAPPQLSSPYQHLNGVMPNEQSKGAPYQYNSLAQPAPGYHHLGPQDEVSIPRSVTVVTKPMSSYETLPQVMPDNRGGFPYAVSPSVQFSPAISLPDVSYGVLHPLPESSYGDVGSPPISSYGVPPSNRHLSVYEAPHPVSVEVRAEYSQPKKVSRYEEEDPSSWA
jgi:hypothetical protein